MKTIDVIKHASSRAPFKVRSSLLRWEPASCSLLIRVGGQWRPAVSIFDGVFIQYQYITDDIFGKRKDRSEFEQFIANETRELLHLFIRPQLPCSVEDRTPSRTAMLRGIVDNLCPKVDRDMYWQWAFQFMLISYCHTVRSAASELDSKLNALVTSTSYSQLSRDLEALTNTVSRGNVLNYSPDAVALKASIDKVNSSLYYTVGSLGVAYSTSDNKRYSRPDIRAKRLTVDDSGNWESPTYTDHPITIENPAMLMDHWSDLVNVLASVGIAEPTPYGLTFSQENFAALASLNDVAELDYKEPQKWREAATGSTPTAFEESTPVSAMEFA